MVIPIHPSHSQPRVDSAIESFSYRWLVTMATLGLEPPSSSHVHDSNCEGKQQPEYFIDVDPEAAPGGGGRQRSSSVVDHDLEFEFLLPPSRCSPSPADQIISGGLLLPLCRPQDCKENDKITRDEAARSPDRDLSRSLSADSWTSCRTMFSSFPSRSSSASSSSCSSMTPLRSKTRRLEPPVVPPPISTGLSPLPPRPPKRRQESKVPKREGITLSSIPHKIAQLCMYLLAAACRRAAPAVSAANNNGSCPSGSSRRRDSKTASSAAPRDNRKKKGRTGVQGLSSAIQWCRTDADVAAVENSIQEAVMHCKRSYARTG